MNIESEKLKKYLNKSIHLEELCPEILGVDPSGIRNRYIEALYEVVDFIESNEFVENPLNLSSEDIKLKGRIIDLLFSGEEEIQDQYIRYSFEWVNISVILNIAFGISISKSQMFLRDNIGKCTWDTFLEFVNENKG